MQSCSAGWQASRREGRQAVRQRATLPVSRAGCQADVRIHIIAFLAASTSGLVGAECTGPAGWIMPRGQAATATARTAHANAAPARALNGHLEGARKETRQTTNRIPQSNGQPLGAPGFTSCQWRPGRQTRIVALFLSHQMESVKSPTFQLKTPGKIRFFWCRFEKVAL